MSTNPKLQNGNSFDNQKFVWWLPYGYRKKPTSKKSIVLFAGFWVVYILAVSVALQISTGWKIAYVLLGLLNLSSPLYMLAKGLYMQPGETYEIPKPQDPNKFLESVKKDVKNDKN